MTAKRLSNSKKKYKVLWENTQIRFGVNQKRNKSKALKTICAIIYSNDMGEFVEKIMINYD